MPVTSLIPRIPGHDFEQTTVDRSTRHPEAQQGFNHFWNKGYHIDAHDGFPGSRFHSEALEQREQDDRARDT
jgi:hypothetical protein